MFSLTMFRSIFTRVFVLVLIMDCNVVRAFSGRTSSRHQTGETKLFAWSLPSPSDFTSFASMKKSTWYDEYNPTARRTVYNDRFYEDLTFSSLGTDWPSLLDELEPTEAANQGASAPPRRNRNPLRRVAGLASRLRGRA